MTIKKDKAVDLLAGETAKSGNKVHNKLKKCF